MNQITQQILEEVAQLHGIPEGAYNIRENGKSVGRSSTEEIQIETRADQKGIEVRIRPGTKNKSVHIPVVISQSGLEEVVYNDFYIGDDCDVTIIAGCGIHNAGNDASRHDGVHSFTIGKNAKVKYVEKHYGSGDGNGERIMNPETIVDMEENSYMEMDTVQIKGVDSTIRKTTAHLKDGARLVVMERLMTHGKQRAESYFDVYCDGEDSGAAIGYRGEVLDALQYLTSLVANKDKTSYKRVILDTEAYREKRVEKLKVLAKNLESKAIRTGKPVKLEPMNSFERRIIHSALQDSEKVKTLSEGTSPNRYVIILPKENEQAEHKSERKKMHNFVYRSEKKRRSGR